MSVEQAKLIAEVMRSAADTYREKNEPWEGKYVGIVLGSYAEQLSNALSEAKEPASGSPLQSVAQSATDEDGPLNPARSDGPLDDAYEELREEYLRRSRRWLRVATGWFGWMRADHIEGGRLEELWDVLQLLERIKCEPEGRET